MNAGLKALLDNLINLAVKSWIGLTGIKGYLAKKILECGGQYIFDMVNLWISKLKRKKEQEKALDHLEKVDQDPASTIDDKGKSYEDMFNSGR